MDKREETSAKPSSAQSKSKVQLPRCVSTFQDQLSNIWGSESNPEVELRPDSAADAVSSRMEKLGEGGKSGERYILKGEVGRGGMGAILKIFDADLRRNLAMKTVLSSGAGTSAGAEKIESGKILRLIEEAQVTGQLDHPGVVPVHELGIDKAGHVYFTMRLVKGQELTQVFESVHGDDPDWNMTRALGALLRVCEAMSYAHEKGVVHRDLKPANVMVGRHGAVYVMDWGLARVDGREDSHDVRPMEQPVPLSELHTDRRDLKQQGSESPLMTMDGTVLGTPFYMPPEQAAGMLEKVGPHSDVYAVGAMLYHLLCGQMPFYTPGERVAPVTTLARVLLGPPTPIHELAPNVAPELVAICEKAMEREISKRYSNMGELAEDLRAYLENRVVRAHQRGAVVELKKWVQRNKALASMILAFVVLSVGGSTTAAVIFGAKNETIRVARDDALHAKGLAENAKGLAEVAAENEKHQRELAQDNEQRARDAEGQAVREAERATMAESEAAARADELRRVVDFQAEQLGALDVHLMGVWLRTALVDATPVSRREELTHNLAGLNFTDLALGSLENNFFTRTIEAIDDQFEEQPLVQAQLLQSIVLTLETLGLYSMASDPQTRALSIRRSKLGDDHVDTLSSVHDMGNLLLYMGQFGDALPYFSEALEGRRRELGNDDPDTLQSVVNMGVLLKSMGQHEDALPYYTEALEGNRRVLGDDDHATLASVNNMGYLLQTMGQFEDALPYYTEALEGNRRVLGDDDPATLISINNMGVLLKLMGQREDALTYYTEALEGRRRIQGSDHPETLVSVLNMGSLLRLMSQFEEARPYLAEAFEWHRRELGEDHPNTVASREYLRSLYEDWFTELLAEHGEYFPLTLTIQRDRAVFLNSLNQAEEAEVLLLDCLDKRLEVLGESNPDTFQLYHDLASLYSQQGRVDEAEGFYLECLNLQSEVLGQGDPETLESLEGLARLYADNNRWKAASPRAQRLVALTPKNSPQFAGRKQLLQLIESKQE